MQGEGYSIGTFERTFKFLLVFMESNACRACVQSGCIQETFPKRREGTSFLSQLLCHCSRSSPSEQVRLCSKQV